MPLPATRPTHAPAVLAYARPPRRLGWVVAAWVCSCYPLLAVAMVHVNAACARVSLGHWPRPFIDPAVTPLARFTLGVLSWLPTALALSAAIAAVGMIATVAADEPPPRRSILALVLPVFTWGLTVVLAAWDPLDAVVWLLD